MVRQGDREKAIIYFFSQKEVTSDCVKMCLHILHTNEQGFINICVNQCPHHVNHVPAV